MISTMEREKNSLLSKYKQQTDIFSGQSERVRQLCKEMESVEMQISHYEEQGQFIPSLPLPFFIL